MIHVLGLNKRTQWLSHKLFLMVSFFMDTPVYSNPESNFLDRYGSSRVASLSHNKSKYQSKSTMAMNKNT
ncbi:hypothetical protein Hanom_Chr09g00787441 [Helianthus anomalus]